MANGDITIEQAQKLFAGEPIEKQMALLYQAVVNQSKICQSRPENCGKIYVSKQWLKEKRILFSGVAIGILIVNGCVVFGISKLLNFL